MNFTNTDCVGKNWYWYDVWGHVTWQVKEPVDEQVKWQVDAQIYPIRYKITQEINK